MNANRDTTVIFLGNGGYKLSSWYGKVLHNDMHFDTLGSAEKFCEDAGYDYVIA